MYNEERGADTCVRTVGRAIASLPARAALIVVDDGSTDKTPEVLARLRAEGNEFTTVTHEHNRGYGVALRTGAKVAAAGGYAYVLFMDSDLTNDPASLPSFLQRMREGCDVIKASRYALGGGVVGIPAWKVALSYVGNRIAGFLFRLPLTDSTNGFRALRTEIFRRLDITEPGFASIMQEIHQAKYLTRSFCEVPCTLTARLSTLRRSSFSYRPRVLYSYLKYPVRSFFGRSPAAVGGDRKA